MGKQQGHYCRICKQRKANEKFSGKGHATHVCKACAKRGNKPPEVVPEVPFIDNEEEFFSAYELPLDVIPEFDFEEQAFQYAIDTGSPKANTPQTKRKPAKKKKVKPPHKIQAKEFLSVILADGAKPKNEIVEAAEKTGISLQALRLAKGSLGVRSETADNGSVWFLPSQNKEMRGANGYIPLN